MSAPGGIALRSHVYGSTPRGFATIYADPTLEPELQREIERRCSYSLPFSLARSEPGQAPVKYLFGRHGGHGFVGRARYLGVDVTGRLGNYVCHTLVFDLEEASRLLEGPLDLLVRCESADLFLEATPAEGETAGPHTLEIVGVYTPRRPGLPQDLLLDLVSAALRGPGAEPPVMLRGGEDEIVDALEDVFACLPYSKRWACTFDTYGLAGFPQGLVFTGLPASSAYSPTPPHTASVDLSAGTIAWVRGAPARHALAGMVCSAALDAEERAVLLSAVDLIEGRQWVELVDTLGAASERVMAALHTEYRAALLERIATAADGALAQALDAAIEPDDVLAVAHTLRAALVRTSGPKARGAFARAVVTHAADSSVAGLAFADEQFVTACVDVARVMQQAQPFTLALARALPAGYEPWREQRVMKAVLEELRVPAPPAFLAALREALGALPAAPTAEIERERALAQHAAGQPAALARFVAAAGRTPGYWDGHVELVRYVAESAAGMEYEDAARVVALMLPVMTQASVALLTLDRVLAGRWGRKGGPAEEKRERKAIARAMERQGVALEFLPETYHLLFGESDAAPGAADKKRGWGR